MFFYRNSTKNIETNKYTTIKIYKCPICKYVYKTKEERGKITVLKGDEEIIIFPFFSLARENGSHMELCGCPHCQTIQYINKIDTEKDLKKRSK